jgi:hypothetical protein
MNVFALSLFALAAGLLAAFMLPTSPAIAVDATKPTPCTGQLLIEDPAGDQQFDSTGFFGVPEEGTPNADITGVFFNYRPGADGNKVLTANLRIANLDKTVPGFPQSGAGLWYYVFYAIGDVTHFVKAVNASGDEITYHYGTMATEGATAGIYTTEGETKGAFFEGPDGVIQIDVPEAAGAAPGASFANVIGYADTIFGLDDEIGFNVHADTAPNEGDPFTAGSGAAYTVEDCPATGGGAGTTTGTTTGTTGTTTGTTGTAPATLPLKASRSLGSAAKAKRQKRFTVTLTASQPITNLQVKLKKSSGTGPVLASGKLAQLNGKAKLRLKLLRKVKRGKYALLATGTVNGAKRKATLKVTVKK